MLGAGITASDFNEDLIPLCSLALGSTPQRSGDDIQLGKEKTGIVEGSPMFGHQPWGTEESGAAVTRFRCTVMRF